MKILSYLKVPKYYVFLSMSETSSKDRKGQCQNMNSSHDPLRKKSFMPKWPNNDSVHFCLQRQFKIKPEQLQKCVLIIDWRPEGINMYWNINSFIWRYHDVDSIVSVIYVFDYQSLTQISTGCKLNYSNLILQKLSWHLPPLDA